MWLLKVLEGAEPGLVWTNSSEVQTYAVLSHTWQDAEELSFQEMQQGLGKEKSGYEKILGACSQALKDGLNYVWIDTVCINKQSSAELTEAINSMWQWYCDASVCYVFMGDVDADCHELGDIEDNWYSDTDPQPGDPYEQAFAASRWFKRGWTLQELLAPEHLVFYNSGWCEIGTKAALLNRLHNITGIDKLALEVRQSISSFVIARRMCWAAGRKTTRIEDRAYSLLGIFGITMPMLYGEGSRAFTRLQEELLKISTDHSVFAWEWSEEPQLHDDMLLAFSPDNFFPRGRRMIRWMGSIADRPFTLTNRGVMFDHIPRKIPLTSDGELGHMAWVILNCRDENDYGALALQLVRRDQHTAQVEPSLLDWNEAFWVSWRPGTTRLSVWKSDIPSAGKFTLLRRHLASAWSSRLTPRFRIRLEPAVSNSFACVDGWPRRLWQPELDTMSLPRQTSYPELVTASVSIRFKGYNSGSFVHIAFCFSPHGDEPEPLLALSRSCQEDARTMLKTIDTADEVHDFHPVSDDDDKGSWSTDLSGKLDTPQRVYSEVRLPATDVHQLLFYARMSRWEGDPEHRAYAIDVLWADSVEDLSEKEKKLQRKQRDDFQRHERRRSYRWANGLR